MVSLRTLLPGRVHTREGKEHTTELSSTREQNEYISGETQTARQSQLSSNRQRSLRHVCRFHAGGSDGIEDLTMYEGWRITLYRVWTEHLQGSGVYTYQEEKLSMKTLVQNMTLLTEMNFEGGFIKTKLPIMGHYKKSGTFSKCGLLTLSIILSHSFSSMYISLYKLLDP